MAAVPGSVEIEFMTKGVKYVAFVSPEDEERVRAVRWRNWSGYAHNPKAGTLHAMIIGERPADVPENYVIDHCDRNKLNNTRENLRWVSPDFNLWNHERARSGTYRGALLNRGKWNVYLCGVNYGRYDDERTAGRVYVKAAIVKFGELAAMSDILVGDGPGKFSAAEIEEIKKEIAAGDVYVKNVKKSPLPVGIYLTPGGNCYLAKFKGKVICGFGSLLRTQAFRDEFVREFKEREWADHLSKEITRDAAGDAVIALGGTHGSGKVTKVPAQFWHKLTFHVSYHCDVHGYARSSKGLLHAVVWKMLHPGYTPVKGYSIDHVDPAAKLDNREENLRLESASGQARNKVKRSGSSKYKGVRFDTRRRRWLGYFRHDGKTRQFYADTEDAAYARLVAAKKEGGFTF